MSPRKASVKATTPKEPWIFNRNDKTLTLNGFITLVKKDKETGDIVETTYLNKSLISETVVGAPGTEIMLGMSNGTKYFVVDDGVHIVVTDKSSGGGGGGGGGDDPDPSGIATRLRLTDQDIPEDEYELKIASGRLTVDPAED